MGCHTKIVFIDKRTEYAACGHSYPQRLNEFKLIMGHTAFNQRMSRGPPSQSIDLFISLETLSVEGLYEPSCSLQNAPQLSSAIKIGLNISTHTSLAGCDGDILCKASQSPLHMGWTFFLFYKYIHKSTKKLTFSRRTSHSFLYHRTFAKHNSLS